MSIAPAGRDDLVAHNKLVVQRLYDEVFARGNLQVAEELVAPQARDLHDPQDRRGPERVKEVALMLLRAFPDQRWETHRLVADEEFVAMYSTWSGTNLGPFMGQPPTRHRVAAHHMYLFRLQGQQVTEYAAVRDDLAMLSQLAVAPPWP